MKIQVTQEDLDAGKRCSAWNSPLSYAFMRAFNSKSVFIGRTICLDNNTRIDLEGVALEKLTAFDNGKKLEPFYLTVSGDAVYYTNNHIK